MNRNLTEKDMQFYENVRFVYGGNSLTGADCFGLFKIFNKREFDIDIGEYDRSRIAAFLPDATNNFYNKALNDKLILPCEPYTGCLVVISIGGHKADHLCIWVSENKALSTTLVQGYSQIIDISEYKILGYYEFNSLENL